MSHFTKKHFDHLAWELARYNGPSDVQVQIASFLDTVFTNDGNKKYDGKKFYKMCGIQHEEENE